LAILDEVEARRTSRFLFGGARTRRPIADTAMLEKLNALAPGLTVHGFRSSFRDWCADNGVPRELAEACLGHAIGNKTEMAYLRTDQLEGRREVMARWAAFVTAGMDRLRRQARSGDAMRRCAISPSRSSLGML